MTHRNYDPAKLSVVCGGIPIHGFAEDTMFDIEFEDDQYNESSDIRGNITRVKVNKNSATLTLHILQNSSSNDVFNSFIEADRLSNSGVFPVIIKDEEGNTIFACSAAYVKGISKASYGSENNTREWIIRATGITKFI